MLRHSAKPESKLSPQLSFLCILPDYNFELIRLAELQEMEVAERSVLLCALEAQEQGMLALQPCCFGHGYVQVGRPLGH